MKFILLYILALSSSISFAREGSWTSGGGGTGIACFDSEASARAIRSGADFENNPELVDSLASVYMTDYAENMSDTFVAPFENESPSAYLDRVVESRLRYAPSFFKILRQALTRVQVSTVATNAKLRASNDTGGLRNWTTSRTSGDRTSTPMELGPKCVLVQVALRTSVTGKGSKQSVRITVNQILYNHLGDGSARLRTINQAVLMLHEALYLVASELGQKTSLNTRVLTATLLANNRIDYFAQNARWVRSLDPKSVNPEGMLMQQELSIDGFASAFAPKVAAGEDNSLGEALKSFQAKQQVVQEAYNGVEVLSDEGQRIAAKFYDSMSGAEGVIMISSMALQRGRISDISSVVDPDAPDHKTSLDTVCSIAAHMCVGTGLTADAPELAPHDAQIVAANKMAKRAAAYCATLK